MEAANIGLRVLLIDAGDTRRGGRGALHPPTLIVDPARHAPLDLTTRQGVGGTSWLWGGRCVAFQPADFEDRAHVPHGGWPIGYEDVAPWYAAAARHLDCGAASFRSGEPEWDGLTEVASSDLERWARQPRLGPRLGARVLAHPKVTTMLNSRLVDIAFDDEQSVSGLVIEHAGLRREVRAQRYVLAMGGLEVTRALLEVQRRRPSAFGRVDGPLGRYYMGHATGTIADVVLTDPDRAADLDFVRDEHDTYVRRRFTLLPEAQRKHRVLNTSFYLDNPHFYEHGHRNGTLSAVFLGIAFAPLGRAILAEGIRLRHIGSAPRHTGAHIANILRQPWRVAVDLLGILRRRYLSAVRKPGFILRSAGGRYALHYHGEQLPNPDSRLRITAADDGTEILEVDFRYLDEDIDSLLRSHDVLDTELRAAGIGRLEYHHEDPAARRAELWEQAADGYHSIGTTRMSDDPARGVVDGDCRVHGVGNLYITSSSVLPISAEANPTFVVAALAVRLAHHLAGLYAPEPSPAVGLAGEGDGVPILHPGIPVVQRSWEARRTTGLRPLWGR
ncbi:GMC oxidoreductase [Microbacterium caowuchunii]|uniref:GMC oxidoreductase n=2 Tax=Microbacterium caowuchunii TaxID=2614638 RepID=A0A5N0TAQ2_9MICO|nr:GMC oxidoreductase [Microbacterium caowuchunii]